MCPFRRPNSGSGAGLSFGLAGLALMLALVLGGKVAAAPSADQLYRQSQVAPGKVSYRGIQMTTAWYGSRAESFLQQVFHQPPNRYRIEYQSPPASKGQVIIYDGSTLWEYRPSLGRATARPFSAAVDSLPGTAEPQEVFKSNYRVSLQGPGVVAGRSCRVLKLVSSHSGLVVRRIWVDNSTGLALRTDDLNPDGALESTTEFREITFLARLDKELFTPRFPGGTGVSQVPQARLFTTLEQADTRLGTRLLRAGVLPRGYRLQSIRIINSGSAAIGMLQFTDGLRHLSLFQEKSSSQAISLPGGRRLRRQGFDGLVGSRGNTWILVWKDSSLVLTLMGEAGLPDLLAMARGLHR